MVAMSVHLCHSQEKQHTKTLVWLHFDLKAIKDGAVIISEQGQFNLFAWSVANMYLQKVAVYFLRMLFSQLHFVQQYVTSSKNQQDL